MPFEIYFLLECYQATILRGGNLDFIGTHTGSIYIFDFNAACGLSMFQGEFSWLQNHL